MVVTTVTLLEDVEVFIVTWTLACAARNARTASARARASFALPLAPPVMVTDAPATSFFASALSCVRSLAVSVLDESPNVVVTAAGRGGGAT